jgi:hypothetical protein
MVQEGSLSGWKWGGCHARQVFHSTPGEEDQWVAAPDRSSQMDIRNPN